MEPLPTARHFETHRESIATTPVAMVLLEYDVRLRSLVEAAIERATRTVSQVSKGLLRIQEKSKLEFMCRENDTKSACRRFNFSI
jgi:hypothetical protein